MNLDLKILKTDFVADFILKSFLPWISHWLGSISSRFGSSVLERLSTAYFFSRERQRGSRDLTFPAFAVCRPPFLLEEDIFPAWRERENVSICSPFLLSISPF